jgi:PD-(D/E)XK nuclease superfamily
LLQGSSPFVRKRWRNNSARYCIVVELKAVEHLQPVCLAQVITYLKITGYPAGLLMNFNCTSLRAGLRRLDHPDRYVKKRARIIRNTRSEGQEILLMEMSLDPLVSCEIPPRLLISCSRARPCDAALSSGMIGP